MDVTRVLRWLLSRRERRHRRKLRDWEATGRPLPPPAAAKHQTIREFARRYHLRTFVETGTYVGGTVAAVRDLFDRIYSIELDPVLYARARERFRRNRHVMILHGDSANVLPRLLRDIHQPALFWLDGHYSGGATAKGTHETPIRGEIHAIFAHGVEGHVILVDDARAFGVWPDYPTLQEFRELVCAHDPALAFDVRDDIIRIHSS